MPSPPLKSCVENCIQTMLTEIEAALTKFQEDYDNCTTDQCKQAVLAEANARINDANSAYSACLLECAE